MKKDVNSIKQSLKRLLKKTDMDIVLTATADDNDVSVEITFSPKNGEVKRAGF